MASALTILIILAAAGSLIAWLDWISRNIDEALDEAVGKLSDGGGVAGRSVRGGRSGTGPTGNKGKHRTSSVSHSGPGGL